MRDTLIIFARALRLGTVKRRLARGVGDRATLRLYRGGLDALCRAVGRDRRWRTVLCATPDGARCRWPRGVDAVLPQGRGDLGRRLHRATLPHRRVVVVGSDIPGIRAGDVAAAFRALRAGRACFGPAADGGYWLVGLPPSRPARPFAAVRWSTEHALADTRANFRGRRVTILRELRDMDTAADLAALRAEGLLGAGTRLASRRAR